ncbi:hypothetical protein BCR32DRAFT_265604 [Anaeromyces robustus]|uniref:Uncharacterized protein n=1 Tax=Anaeromyces robustus TaxID=1754192 RepID=A0A1Y1XIF7_9FUNG|nr:hypothetical protein BCR32DRAFT_265604 [Anaeromyces robustus]|eukprot:ORX85548.1 hypothetical protein BCR32DRAFT_265604 [Anaeromyces robustus]
MATYKIKFITNAASLDKYGYPIDISLLPITEELKNEIQRLVTLHRTALNWDDPGSGLLWSDEQITDFLNETKIVYQQLCKELGSDYEVEFISEIFMYDTFDYGNNNK